MGKVYGIKAGQQHEYVLKSQRGDSEEDQIKFLVRYLTAEEYAQIQDRLYRVTGIGEDREEHLMTGEQTINVLVLGLCGWKNFTFGDGTDVPWDDPSRQSTVEGKRRVMIENINRIPSTERLEIAAHIRGESTLGEEK